MAENVQVTPGSGPQIAADEVTINGQTVLTQRIKTGFGVDGSYADVSTSNPLPITQATQPLPTGAATSAKQDTGNTSLSSVDGKITKADTDNAKIISSYVPGFNIPPYDYVSLAQASTTDTYTFKSGGGVGTTVATLTITYTDSTKVTISNVAKT